MFPISFNFPFRKKDGSMTSIGDAIDNAGGGVPSHTVSDKGKYLGVDNSGDLAWSKVPDELPAYTASESGKFLGVDSSGDLAWSNAGGGGSGTTSLTELAISDFPYTATSKGFVMIFARGSDTAGSQAHYYFGVKLNDTGLMGSGKDFNQKASFVTVPVNVGDIVDLTGNPTNLSLFVGYMLTQ